MKKRTALITFTSLCMAVALGITACGGRSATSSAPQSAPADPNAGSFSDALYERKITLSDGRIVTCVVYSAGYQGGVSCDWTGAKRPE